MSDAPPRSQVDDRYRWDPEPVLVEVGIEEYGRYVDELEDGLDA
ncbi:hypothetical protein [Haloarchaeobius sp. HRN-SO-5]